MRGKPSASPITYNHSSLGYQLSLKPKLKLLILLFFDGILCAALRSAESLVEEGKTYGTPLGALADALATKYALIGANQSTSLLLEHLLALHGTRLAA